MHAVPLCILQLSEDKRKENRLSLYIIQNHQEPALDIRSYHHITYHRATSTTRQSNTQHFILHANHDSLHYQTSYTSGKQLKNGTSCHHQCMMNLNFKLYRLAILRAYLFFDA